MVPHCYSCCSWGVVAPAVHGSVHNARGRATRQALARQEQAWRVRVPQHVAPHKRAHVRSARECAAAQLNDDVARPLGRCARIQLNHILRTEVDAPQPPAATTCLALTSRQHAQ